MKGLSSNEGERVVGDGVGDEVRGERYVNDEGKGAEGALREAGRGFHNGEHVGRGVGNSKEARFNDGSCGARGIQISLKN